VRKTTNSRELFLDYDRPRGPTLKMIWTVLRACDLRPERIEYRRSRRGWHCVIRVNAALLPAEQVALQAVMGSDSRRELLNAMRVLSIRRRGARPFWRARWNLLYAHKL
jgi:hypothetical protein